MKLLHEGKFVSISLSACVRYKTTELILMKNGTTGVQHQLWGDFHFGSAWSNITPIFHGV
jgi:hypothetical protein